MFAANDNGPRGYTVEDVSRFDGGPPAYSFARPDGTLGDDAWTDPRDAWADACRDRLAAA